MLGTIKSNLNIENKWVNLVSKNKIIPMIYKKEKTKQKMHLKAGI